MASTWLLRVTIITAGAITFVYANFIVYLGVYGYLSSDSMHSYYIEGLETPWSTTEQALNFAKSMNVDVNPRYPVDMAHLFRAWFIWGFWSHIVGLIIQLVFVPMFFLCRVSSAVPLLTYMALQGINCCNMILWFLMGFFWRFSRAGRITSGEKIDKTGLQGEELNQKLADA